jgi:hypothetical protein
MNETNSQDANPAPIPATALVAELPAARWMDRFYFRAQGVWLSTGLVLYLFLIHLAPDTLSAVDPINVISQYKSLTRGSLEVMMRIAAVEFVWTFLFNLFYVRSLEILANLLLFFSCVFIFWVALLVGGLEFVSGLVEAVRGPSQNFMISPYAALYLFAAASTFIMLCPFLPRIVHIERGYWEVFWLYECIAIFAAFLATIEYRLMSGGDVSGLGSFGYSFLLLAGAVYVVVLATVGYGWWLDVKVARGLAAA